MHHYVAEGTKVGFFTDPTVCIGCKACEVACKEWNQIPEDGLVWTGNSYDNSGSLGGATWRHVKFRELDRQVGPPADGPATDGSRIRSDGSFFPMSASTANTPVASRPVRRAPSFERK